MIRFLSLKTDQHETSRPLICKCGQLPAVVAIAVCVCTGCQTMRSFPASSIEKVTSARNWARDGFAAVKQGKLAKAKMYFSNAARELPEDHRLAANLARTEFDQGNIDSAIATMERAASNSGDPALHVEVGNMHLAAGHWLPANWHTDVALEKDYRLPQAWILKGKLAASKGDRQTALRHFQRASGLDGKNEELQLLIAQTYLAMGRPMQSLSATETLLATLEMAAARPQCSKQIFFQLGQIQLQAGLPEKAHATLMRGQQIYPTEPVFGQLLASISANPRQLSGPNQVDHTATPHRVALAPSNLDSR